MRREKMWTRIAYPVPYAHEATATVTNTVRALVVEKWGTIEIAGDSENQLSNLTLKGVDLLNSDIRRNPNALTLYWKLTDAAGTRTVSLYNSQAMDANSKVAEGSKAGDGTITLNAQNNSGITGTVDVTFKEDSAKPENQIVILPRAVYAKVTIDSQPIRYWNDGSVPTANDGLYAAAGTVIELRSSEEIINFKMIRQGATDANATVVYYE